jgi:hypothetical protein
MVIDVELGEVLYEVATGCGKEHFNIHPKEL